MKKLLTIAALAATASLSFGQGYVSFFNASGSRVSTNGVASANGGSGPALQAAAAVGTYYYALLVAPTTQTTVDASFAGWTFSGSYGTNTATAARMIGANNADGLGTSINGFGTTATANFVVVGWNNNPAIGTSWAQALAWWNNGAPTSGSGILNFGFSPVAVNIALAASGGPYNNVWGPAVSGQIPGFVMGTFSIPEPSTFALAGLGAAALLIFRRRK